MKPTAKHRENLKNFGFAFPFGSPHVSRTLMLSELDSLIEFIGDHQAPKERYFSAIVEENCLAKRTATNRAISKRYLVELYCLDINCLLYRALLFFWQRDPTGRPLLALLCAYTRDPLLRMSAEYILPLAPHSTVTRAAMESFLNSRDPERYSPGKLASNAKNLNSTWTQTGHLVGRTQKNRTLVTPTAGTVAYALLIGYLTGVRGQALMKTQYVNLIDCTYATAIELAEEASRKGWIVLKRVGDVIEVLFPSLVNEREMEWIHEQD